MNIITNMSEKTVTIRRVGSSLGVVFIKGVVDVYDFKEGEQLIVDYDFPKIVFHKQKVKK